MQTVLQLPPKQGNPRNSEGDFIQLNDGRLLFVYTHFTGGGEDHASAFLAKRTSDDGGLTWTPDDVVIVPNEARQNVMSVSLLRLHDDRIALFYLRKNASSDCRPYVRYSSDEAQTWSEAQQIIPDEHIGYYVLNNDRAVQLKSGRILLPLARHDYDGDRWIETTAYGTILCYLSDDGGVTWRPSQMQRDGSEGKDDEGVRIMLQEPGIVELKDGRLLMFCRTDAGSQYVSVSKDDGDTWTPFEASTMFSPRSPASIERIPATGDLLLVWNDHTHIRPELEGKRTPLCTAISRNEGETWGHVKVLEDNPHGWYCYTAIEFVGDQVLLAYCAGDRRENNGLAETHIVRLPVAWLYS